MKSICFLPLLYLAVCSGASEHDLHKQYSIIDDYYPIEEDPRSASLATPLHAEKRQADRFNTSIVVFEETAVDGNGTFAKVDADDNTATESTANSRAKDQVVYISIDNFEKEVLESEVPVLVDFTASWCGPCRILDPVVESLMPELSGRAKVYMVDTDESPEIATKYKVTRLPTIVFFDDGIESHRTSSIYPRDTYMRYLDGLGNDSSIEETTLELLDEDWFRRHFLLTERVAVIQGTMDRYPGLLTKEFANGQTPLSAVLNYPHTRNEREAILKLILAQSPAVATNDLPGLGRCEEFMRVIAVDPEAVNRPDPDGNTPLLTAIFNASRLAHAGLGHGECVSAVLESGAEKTLPATLRNSLGKDVEIKANHKLVEDLLDLLTKEWGPTWYNEDLGYKLRMFGLEIKKFRDLRSEDLIAGQT